jgi:hypothetical protein
MRTFLLLATVAIVLAVASVVKIDGDSTLMLGLVAWAAGLAAYRPRWLRLKYAYSYDGDQEASRFAAAVMAGLFAILLGALVGWRLMAMHRARRVCVAAVASAPPGHAHTLALLATTPIPLGAAVSCSDLLDR